MTRPDAVVVGGGVIGLAAAWRAARSGVRVEVVDPAPGSGASSVAAGMLAPVTEVHYGEEPLLALALASAGRYPSFVAELEQEAGRPAGYRACGTLAVAADHDDNAALGELFEFQRRLGLDVTRLTSRECRRLEPALAPSVRGGVHVAGDHQIDPRALVASLVDACRAAGVALTAARVAGIAVEGDRVTGVTLPGGEVRPAGTVVVAAGAWSSQLAGLPPDAVPPVRPVKGQILRLRGPAADPLLSGTVRGLVGGSAVYLVPRADGRIVVGATAEERGFDPTVTAGAVYELLRDAAALVPGVTELELAEVGAGFRPGSPDNAPLIGAAGIDGLLLATGHHRNGVLLAPITADAVAALLTTGRAPEVAAPFTPGRFARVGAR